MLNEKTENTIDFDQVKKEAKKKRFKRKAKELTHSTFEWIVNNKELAMLIGTVSITAIKGGTRVANKLLQNRNLKMEQKLKDTRIYDHSLGLYHVLSRPLTPSQAIEISDRRANGEKLAVILNDMKVLKK